MTPWDPDTGFPKNIIENQKAAEFEGSSMPHFPKPMAVSPENIFIEMQETSF